MSLHGKTNNLHRRKQRRRSASQFISFAVTDQRTRIVQFLYFIKPKFPASNDLLCMCSFVCVGPVRKPHCCFSHEAYIIYHRNYPPQQNPTDNFSMDTYIISERLFIPKRNKITDQYM